MSSSPPVLTIDGGFATQLQLHVPTARVDGDPLWSARFNATAPAAVVRTHLDFLRAGARIILTNTYQASLGGYAKHLQLDAAAAIELIESTVRLAHEARETFAAERPKAARPLVFASIGPYGAHLNDGSEYTGDYADRLGAAAIGDFHRERLRAVVRAGVDGVAIETIPCRMEAEAMVELMEREFAGVPYWLSFQCSRDGVRLAHEGEDERFGEVARAVWERVAAGPRRGDLLAVGVNCLDPQVS